MITDLLKMATKAQKGHYAIPAFNVSDLEMTQAVVRAAVKLKSPVIVQVSDTALKFAGAKTLYEIIRDVLEDIGRQVPGAIHLDHGKNLTIVKQCLKLGFNSVHRDASQYPLAKNISETRKAVVAAKKYRARVQGEVGALFGSEGLTKSGKGLGYRQMMTDPKQVKEFVARTGVDTLAVAVGTLHGSFKGVEKIDLPRIKAIRTAVKVPLVLHGGSGNDPKQIKAAIRAGIAIINVDTDLRIALVSGLKRTLKSASLSGKVDPRKLLAVSYEYMQAEAEQMIRIFGSADKA